MQIPPPNVLPGIPLGGAVQLGIEGGAQDDPSVRDLQILSMMPAWERVRMALTDSSSLRGIGSRFIPQLPGEDSDGYAARSSKFVHVPWFEELTELSVHKL